MEGPSGKLNALLGSWEPKSTLSPACVIVVMSWEIESVIKGSQLYVPSIICFQVICLARGHFGGHAWLRTCESTSLPAESVHKVSPQPFYLLGFYDLCLSQVSLGPTLPWTLSLSLLHLQVTRQHSPLLMWVFMNSPQPLRQPGSSTTMCFGSMGHRVRLSSVHLTGLEGVLLSWWSQTQSLLGLSSTDKRSD